MAFGRVCPGRRRHLAGRPHRLVARVEGLGPPHAVHGFDRGDELQDAIAASTATVVKHLGRITGYATGIAFFAHAVGETNQDLKALIGAARVFAGPGFLVPTQNYDLFAWCLANGLRLVMPMTLMSIGLYCEADGAWLPSIVY